MDFRAILHALEPHGKPALVAGFAEALSACLLHAELTTDLRLAHFLAQASEETAGLATTIEYASGRGYEGRADLGNTHSGDGARYKGRGVFQLTGRYNYRAYGRELRLDLEGHPEQAALFPAAALIAAQFWKQRGLNLFADRDDIHAVTHRVNGGENGIANRKLYLARAKQALAHHKGT